MVRAEIVVSRCQNGGGLVGLRCEEKAGGWFVTWSFEIPDRNQEFHSDSGLSGSEIDGAIDIEPGVTCARCQAPSIVLCGGCERVTCWSGQPGSTFTCRWCSASGVVEGHIDRLKTSRDA